MKHILVFVKGSWTKIQIDVSKMVSWSWQVLEYSVWEVNSEGFHLYGYGEVGLAVVRLLWGNLCSVGKSNRLIGSSSWAWVELSLGLSWGLIRKG